MGVRIPQRASNFMKTPKEQIIELMTGHTIEEWEACNAALEKIMNSKKGIN